MNPPSRGVPIKIFTFTVVLIYEAGHIMTYIYGWRSPSPGMVIRHLGMSGYLARGFSELGDPRRGLCPVGLLWPLLKRYLQALVKECTVPKLYGT
jgi:hypothetical protein